LGKEGVMSTKSTPARYGTVAIAFHWSSALGAILALASGLTMANMVAVPPVLLVAHITLGVVVFALTVLRAVWWAVADKRPGPPADQPGWQKLAARLTHGGLYAMLILMGVSGIVTIALSGAIPALLAGAPLPDFDVLVPRVAHGVMSKILIGLLVLHLGAVLYHQLIRRDRLLSRMGVGPA
jgi:cytochrome b561